jgi:hypothetical protein
LEFETLGGALSGLVSLRVKLGTKKDRIVLIKRGACSIIFEGVTAPALSFFFEKYFVFATPPIPFGDNDGTWYK